MKDKVIVKPDHYLINGKKYIRVTKILSIISKPEFYRWYGKIGYDNAKKHMDTRGVHGTKMHKQFQNHLENKEITLTNKEQVESFNTFIDWKKKNNLNPVYLEQRLKNDRYMYAGTVDYIGYVKGKLTILDWKTAKRIYPDYELQLAAYYYMARENYPEADIQQGAIICIRDGKVTEQYIDKQKLEELFEVFKAANILWRWKYEK